MEQELYKEKCESLRDLQRIEKAYKLHEKPTINMCNEGRLNGKGIMFHPLPGFHFGICDMALAEAPLLVDFFLDQPSIIVILVLKGAATYTLKTKEFPAFSLHENMFLLGRCDNILLEMFFPEQECYSHLTFFIQESALRAYLGDSSYQLVRDRIDGASGGEVSSAVATGIAMPELLIQARQFQEWRGDEESLQLRCAALDCFARFFTHNATLEPPASSFICEQDKNSMAKLKANIEKHFLTINSAADICASCGMSFSKANKLFKALYCTTVASYIHQCKMVHAYTLLTNHKCNVSECAFELGYANISHFISVFKKCYNITPKAVMRMPGSTSAAPN